MKKLFPRKTVESVYYNIFISKLFISNSKDILELQTNLSSFTCCILFHSDCIFFLILEEYGWKHAFGLLHTLYYIYF